MRVLVVDDNTQLASLLAELVRFSGHEVQFASRPADAVRIAGKWQPEIVVLDLSSAGADVLELAPLLREAVNTYGELRIVAITGSEFSKEHCHTAGINDQLHRPVTIAQLQSTLHGQMV